MHGIMHMGVCPEWLMMIHSTCLSRRPKTVVVVAYLAVALAWMLSAPAGGEPTAPETAASVVANWLSADRQPLGARLGSRVANVETYRDRYGKPVYFVVCLQPAGFVVVSGDDLVEPIIAFASDGRYDPSLNNPLGALVNADVPPRVEAARSLRARARQKQLNSAPTGRQAEARAKWRRFLIATDEAYPLMVIPPVSGIPELSDPRVDPFVASKWGQTTECGAACYNYYTPPGPEGSDLNYPAGCLATAMAQLMRHYQYPGLGVGTGSFEIKVCGVPESRNLRGGNGYGGPYEWSSMVLDPDCSTTTAQRQAIGAVCHDAGVAAHMDYCDTTGSGAALTDAYSALLYTFHYGNARCYGSLNPIPMDKLYKMINPNLHAAYPVILGIRREGGAHAVVCDGYGYDASTQYHHLNMGWSGLDDVWYNLPTIDTSIHTYTSITGCIYNVYTDGSGEIISGRATDASGSPIAGAAVTAGTHSDTTDARGLYVLAKVPSNTQYVVQVQKDGYLFTSQSVTTGYSQSGNVNAGNLWPIDFVGYEPSIIGDVKQNADTITVAMKGAVVTAVFGDWFYVENENRSGGILAHKLGHGLSEGRKIDLIGVMDTNSDSERFIEATFVDDIEEARLAPVGVSIGALGGADWHCVEGQTEGQMGVTNGYGLNNIGLLVCVWGRVTYTDSHNFTLDDGSPAPGGVVHCVTPSDVTVDPLWQYAAVTGISSCERVGEELHRKLLVRFDNDIRPIVP